MEEHQCADNDHDSKYLQHIISRLLMWLVTTNEYYEVCIIQKIHIHQLHKLIHFFSINCCNFNTDQLIQIDQIPYQFTEQLFEKKHMTLQCPTLSSHLVSKVHHDIYFHWGNLLPQGNINIVLYLQSKLWFCHPAHAHMHKKLSYSF